MQCVYAQDFDLKYDTEYTIDSQARTQVTEQITIINKTDDTIPSQFSITFENADLEVFQVYDKDNNPLKFQVEKNEGGTKITTFFRNPSIGKDKATILIVDYKTSGVIQKIGRNLNIHTPRVPSSESVVEYNLTLKVHISFGTKIYLSPPPLKQSTQDDYHTYTYDKNALNGLGVSASYGENQLLNFELSYNLKNNSIFNKQMEVAFPPIIEGYQDIFIASVEPKPNRIRKDADGNILGIFEVKGRKKIVVFVSGQAKTYNRIIDENAGGNISEIDSSLIRKYTKPLKYWETNTEINNQAKELVKDQTTVTGAAKQIYQFVSRHLTYDYESSSKKGFVVRLGGPEALEKKKGICMEYVDLFISLARAVGLPARQLDGYAYAYEENTPITPNAQGGDYLHSWVQFYDPKLGWLAIDPTWGSTSGLDYFSKLDTNHLAFVIKGENSSYPLPAGAYKLNDSEKQVRVEFAAENVDASKVDWNNYDKTPLKKGGIKVVYVLGFFLTLGLCMIFLAKKAPPKDR